MEALKLSKYLKYVSTYVVMNQHLDPNEVVPVQTTSGIRILLMSLFVDTLWFVIYKAILR